jgi:predicted anti-sigma-YlaC factor YlaD
MTSHLTPNEIEVYALSQIGEQIRATFDEHLATCADCRARIAKTQKIDAALQQLPRELPPPGFDDLVVAAVEWRAGQEQQRRARMPLIALATCFSILLTLWFGFAGLIALQENGVIEFLWIYTYDTDISFSSDALFALLEAFPFTEILLALFALVTAAALGQNLVESLQPRKIGLGRHY